MPKWHRGDRPSNAYLVVLAFLIVFVAFTFVVDAAMMWLRVVAILMLAMMVAGLAIPRNRPRPRQ